MITLIRAAYQEEPRIAEYTGLSTDDKYDKQVISNPQNGDIFKELDTGTVYKYDASSQLWIAQPASGGGGGGGPTYTSGNGINITGTIISAKPGTGIVVDTSGINVDTNVIPNKTYIDNNIENIRNIVDNIVDGTTPITLPTASNTQLGVIKIGEGLEIAEDGTLTVNTGPSIIPNPTEDDADKILGVNDTGDYELSNVVLINGGTAQE